MLHNYLKGVSISVLSSVFTFLLISALKDPDIRLENAFSEFYNFLIIATFVGLLAGMLAIGILRLYSDEDVFSKDLLTIFAVAGIIIGILLDLLFGLSTFPAFLIAALVGSLLFLTIQKINNRLIGWGIVTVLIRLIYIDPQYINYFTSN